MTSLKMLTSVEVLGEIRRLYFETTRDRIEQDFEREAPPLVPLPGS